jgi:hypothetical protein
VIFANTTFIVNTRADFHRLPHETSCLREPWMMKYLVWEIATNHLQKRWRTGDLHVSETLFPGLESMEICCAGPTRESTRVLISFTMAYRDGRTKVLLLGMSHVDGSRFTGTRYFSYNVFISHLYHFYPVLMISRTSDTILMRPPELDPNFPELTPKPPLHSRHEDNASEDDASKDKRWRVEEGFGMMVARLREHNHKPT